MIPPLLKASSFSLNHSTLPTFPFPQETKPHYPHSPMSTLLSFPQIGLHYQPNTSKIPEMVEWDPNFSANSNYT